ncbi:MAG: MFS transporter [Phenylobacterium sp.]|uniref:MFS transporter n=1 Tax=Phenylobacterium sp. TaxID=1871053 RepID=UPI00272F5C5C|nr:MFS transporter [Phenylobacterium sp.]MDP2008873.1 MFS transporter [Phenylobacterium sp.]
MAPAFVGRVYLFKALDAFVLIYPLYTVMFVDHGLTPVQVSATLMAWSITAFILQIPSGVLADRYSRRWILAVAQMLRVIGFLVWIASPSFLSCLVGMMLWGAKSAFTNGVFEALVYDELHGEGRADDYSQVIGRAQGVGFAAVLAASLSASVSVQFGYTAILWASVVVVLGAAGAAVALPRARKTLRTNRHYLALLKQGFQTVAGAPLILGFIAFAALSNAFGGGLEGFWPIFGSETGLPASQVALFVAAISAAQAGGSLTAHRLRRATTSVFFALFAAIGLLIAGAAVSLQPWSVALIIPAAGLFKVVDVNFDARLHHAIPTETRATIAAVKSFSGQVIMTGMLMTFGLLAQGVSYRAAFMACGAAIALIGLAALVRNRLRPPAPMQT